MEESFRPHLHRITVCDESVSDHCSEIILLVQEDFSLH